MEMVILTGCQGAGKTTFYTSTFLHTHVRVNPDRLKTRKREALLIDACIGMRQSFVIDNTNPTRDDRAKYIELVRGTRFKVTGYFFETAIESVLTRNAARSGRARVPEVVVLGTLRRLEIPSVAEGFDTLFRVQALDDGLFRVTGDGSPTP